MKLGDKRMKSLKNSQTTRSFTYFFYYKEKLPQRAYLKNLVWYSKSARPIAKSNEFIHAIFDLIFFLFHGVPANKYGVSGLNHPSNK